eukprot:3428820-Prorocentrum_lima.AAC.1
MLYWVLDTTCIRDNPHRCAHPLSMMQPSWTRRKSGRALMVGNLSRSGGRFVQFENSCFCV